MEKTLCCNYIKNDLKPTLREITLENIDSLKKLNGFDIEYIKKLLKTYENKIIGIGAFIDNNVVGYAWCALKGSRDRQYLIRKTDAYIFDVFVKKQYRGHNFAPLLINELVQECLKAKKDAKICLEVRKNNTPAIKAYKKIGFTVECSKSFLRILKTNIPQHKL